MSVLLIVAHPESKSFNHALHEAAKNLLGNNRIEFWASDLYAESFDAAAGPLDITDLPITDSFQLAKAQRWGRDNDRFCPQISRHQALLVSADTVILQFPLWWWSFPAILKGWVDRVLSSGFAYGTSRTLGIKSVMFSITTGGAINVDEEIYYRDKIDALYQDVFGFLDWRIAPPFIAHGVQHKDLKQRQYLISAYLEHLNAHVLEGKKINEL